MTIGASGYFTFGSYLAEGLVVLRSGLDKEVTRKFSEPIKNLNPELQTVV
jgi:hypothetical protein